MESPFPIEDFRKPDHPIDPMFLKRWSPRSLTGEKIELPVLMTLFEAARWAPSSGNLQPWRFVYALRETPGFDRLYNCLSRGNKSWCDKAAALLVMISKKDMEPGKPNRTHSFDGGAAWVSMALQGSLMNIVVHGMGGFDLAMARETVSLPEDYEINAMAAIGHPAPAELLPERDREKEKPKGRNPVDTFAFADQWPG